MEKFKLSPSAIEKIEYYFNEFAGANKEESLHQLTEAYESLFGLVVLADLDEVAVNNSVNIQRILYDYRLLLDAAFATD
jgi:hypothetical protein